MPDGTLHGNSRTCPTCNGETRIKDPHPFSPGMTRCKACKGRGFVVQETKTIIAQETKAARLTYWPQFEQRIAQHKGTA